MPPNLVSWRPGLRWILGENPIFALFYIVYHSCGGIQLPLFICVKMYTFIFAFISCGYLFKFRYEVAPRSDSEESGSEYEEEVSVQ